MTEPIPKSLGVPSIETATGPPTTQSDGQIRWFADVDMRHTGSVGGKAASLGEMYGHLVGRGVRIPNGFATTADTYRDFLSAPVEPGVWDGVEAEDHLAGLRAKAARATTLIEAIHLLVDDAPADDHFEMHTRTALCRAFVRATPIPDAIIASLDAGYNALCSEYGSTVDVAVRSSATGEDSAIASFAGQYDSYLNIRGIDAVVQAWKACVTSAFTERAVSYQLSNGMDPLEGALSVIVMKMVRSDIATSGVMFTIDPDSGNPNVLHVSSSYGLGEMVVQGNVSPDIFLLWKDGLRRNRPALVQRLMGAKDVKLAYSMQGGTSTESVDVAASRRRQWSLTNEEVHELGRMALVIEDHYDMSMDIEWAKDGYSGELFIVQARPETVHSVNGGAGVLENFSMDQELLVSLKADGKLLVSGQSVGTRIGSGKVRVYQSYEEAIVRKRALRNLLRSGTPLEEVPPEGRVFDPGDVLVTRMTTPDWEPMMKEASLIITERGGRTSHAAIVAREFGIPAIVGCDHATSLLKPLTEVTGTCAEGDTGMVFEGVHPFEVERIVFDEVEELRTQVKLNVGFPDKALADAMLPSDGVGLARLEFILTAQVGVHPLALLYYEELRQFTDTGELAAELGPFAEQLRQEDTHELMTLVDAIERRTPSYADRRQFFVDQVQHGVALICAAFYPRPVLVRLSDLKSNEYRDLLGGRLFEPKEENPMIAWRGASRYIDPTFLPAFDMECDALRAVRQRNGLDNLQVMVPFCRSPEEGRAVVELLDQRGLSPQAGVPLFLMVELPSNVIEAERFIDEMGLTGGSIGSNDLVQTVYAVSRDDLTHYAYPVDARSPAVKTLIRQAVQVFGSRGLEIGICGQAPSDFPNEVPPFLVECGITSISVTPDTLVRVRMAVARAEKDLGPSEGAAPGVAGH
ncbi:MAG: phosphoenolpyruvate synthase [Gemmatimonadota bacterium]|nr:MAG: phosphoenolpyruvate synthase [Gemmatimonadota bacterium]